MSDIEKNDDFWDLSQYAKRKNEIQRRSFPRSDTHAVEISDEKPMPTQSLQNSDREGDDGKITRFIPPKSDSAFKKKYTLFEYEPQNPFIKLVKICSDKPEDSVFVNDNLFIRERRAYLSKTAEEAPRASFYSFSPRYSQMSRSQIKWYLWWRENARQGIFLDTDDSYVVLYLYELAASSRDEDLNAALNMMCALLKRYSDAKGDVVIPLITRDIICDFCLLHGLPSPIAQFDGVQKQLLATSNIPEFFLDISEENRIHSSTLLYSSLSLYDYKRSKHYNDDTAKYFQSSINGALNAVMNDPLAFSAITSFTSGMYGCITVERKPFIRMMHIINRHVTLEITYYQFSSLCSAVTDAIRYSENRLRDHLGIKTKLNVLAVNPHVKSAIDAFFDKEYPPAPIRDRRRRQQSAEPEHHEYDRLYDTPKAEISPERAQMIEQESWNTTKILIEAFEDEKAPEQTALTISESKPIDAIEELPVPQINEKLPEAASPSHNSGLLAELRERIGDAALFLDLCRTSPFSEQRSFAISHSRSVDELADIINECALEVFGDIILDYSGDAYRIIEEYKDTL